MKSFFGAFFGVIVAIFVLVAVVVGFIASKDGGDKKVGKHSYLVIDLYGDVMEYDPPGSIMGELTGGGGETLQRVLSNLEKAAVDKNIDGVILKLSYNNSAGMAMFEEMRGAVKKVRAAGKKVLCYTDSFDRKTYYLAAACDSIYAPPPSYITFLGFSASSQHAKGTADKLGIKMNIHKIREYKAAAEMLTRTNMSPEARANRQWMLDESWAVFVKALADDRGLSEAQIVACMDSALFIASEAKAAGLIDRVLYWNDLENMLKGDEKELRTVSQSAYADVKPEKLGLKGKKKIAIIHAQGMIGGRKSKIDPLWGVMMGHESVNAEIRKARTDKNVAAIVFRVDSGGGESLASDLIGHEIEITANDKPVVASMVDVAASGGYYIAYQATKIVADPTTRTGSIGSISMMANMKGFYDKLGISYDHVTKGPNALFYVDDRDLTSAEQKIFERNHWNDFNQWLVDVAKHRGKTMEEMEKLAMGRVWSGRQAKENGLIDEIGGLDKAIELAKELAKIPADEKVTIVHYPAKKELLEVLLGGEGSLSAVAQYAVYRFIHKDLAETWRMISSGTFYLSDEAAGK